MSAGPSQEVIKGDYMSNDTNSEAVSPKSVDKMIEDDIDPLHSIRPSTPPPTLITTEPHPPRTPESTKSNSLPKAQPRTPFGTSLHPPTSAAVYLSSPIRRPKSMLAAGTMTPGRPSLKLGSSPVSPFKATSRRQGRVSIGNSDGQDLASIPLQFLFMTVEQAQEITDLQVAKESLVASIKQGDAFRRSAQQFRSQASHYLFQNKLMQIENDENEQRYEVEANIQKREVERLVVEIMGYNDKSIDIDQIRERLKSTKQRVKEMEIELSSKNQLIIDLQNELNQLSQKVKAEPEGTDKLSALEVLASQVLTNGIHSEVSTKTPLIPGQSPSNHPYMGPQQYGSSPFSSPYSFPSYNTRPYLNSSSSVPMPQFGSVEKKRRVSSSSTISAMSEEDTLEEVNQQHADEEGNDNANKEQK